MKVVLDSNVIVAAFATQGLCMSVFEFVLSFHSIVCSEYILNEVEKALAKKIKLPTTVVREILALLREQSIISSDFAKLSPNVCRDAADINILSLAVGSQADCIVTGDDDLLVLKEFKKIKLLSPRQFWEFARGQ